MAGVTAVLVTYGERWHLLREVLDELLNHQGDVAAVVLVDNGCSYDLKERLERSGFNDIHLLRLGENLGSAAGFAAGIEEAVRKNASELIWLLDDDNKPKAKCLERLLHTYGSIEDREKTALLALRRTRSEQLEALRGVRSTDVRANSFLGFHFVDLPSKILRRLQKSRGRQGVESPLARIASVTYAPYGGFLFHRRWVEVVGLPDRRYFVYGDDHEYTSRIVRAGGCIFLCGLSEVDDLEESWSRKRLRAPVLISKHANAARAFYLVRNQVFTDWSTRVSNRYIYFANIAVYLLSLTARGLVTEKAPRALVGRLHLLSKAIKDGIAGRLGRTIG
jgi:GT2 family glycosyltransferase